MPENFMPSVLAHQPLPSRRHLQLLALLTLHGRLNITTAARLLCLSQSFTSNLAGHLVDLGCVKRMRGYGDCREVYIFPTATGRTVDATMRCRIQRRQPRGDRVDAGPAHHHARR